MGPPVISLLVFSATCWVLSLSQYVDPEEYAKIWEKQQDEEGMAHGFIGAAKPRRSGYSARRRMKKPGQAESDSEGLDGLDMVLTEEQREWLYGRHQNGSRVKRGGTTVKAKPWPGGLVPYVIVDADFDSEEKSQLIEAMKVYESETCVTFVERTDQVAYVQFQRGKKGCNSWLGTGGKSMQPINLGKGCRTIGTYLHEIGHALGLVHEHQLPNRDEYVHYNPTNVDPAYASQLTKYSRDVISFYDAQYDVSSIMHYEPDAFSFDKKSHTLGVENPFLAVHVGRRYSNMLSYGDVRMVNAIYRCSATCSDASATQTCGGGFINHKCECVTVEAYYSRHCVNDPEEEEECYRKLRNEQCHRASYDLQKKCARACDFCPRFKPGDTAKEPLAPCANVYPDKAKCDAWASAGDCDHQVNTVKFWMRRNCKLSCDVCELKMGYCPNVWPNFMCNGYPDRGICELENRSGDNARKNCPDSCGACGHRNEGECSNRLADSVCESRAKERHCQTQPMIMFQLCRKTCNRCDFNTGSCRNTWPKESECLWWAATNECRGGKRVEFMRTQCAKACNSCDYARSQGMKV